MIYTLRKRSNTNYATIKNVDVWKVEIRTSLSNICVQNLRKEQKRKKNIKNCLNRREASWPALERKRCWPCSCRCTVSSLRPSSPAGARDWCRRWRGPGRTRSRSCSVQTSSTGLESGKIQIRISTIFQHYRQGEQKAEKYQPFRWIIWVFANYKECSTHVIIFKGKYAFAIFQFRM